jgi:hypothetical protein
MCSFNTSSLTPSAQSQRLRQFSFATRLCSLFLSLFHFSWFTCTTLMLELNRTDYSDAQVTLQWGKKVQKLIVQTNTHSDSPPRNLLLLDSTFQIISYRMLTSNGVSKPLVVHLKRPPHLHFHPHPQTLYPLAPLTPFSIPHFSSQ